MANYPLVTIDAEECIGCAKCLQACPVDAIVGAFNQMHTVLPDYCIGCGLCVPVCPVNCFSSYSIDLNATQRHERASLAKQRRRARQARLEAEKESKQNADQQLTLHIQEKLRLTLEQYGSEKNTHSV